MKTFNCEQKSLWSPSSVVPDCVSEGISLLFFFLYLIDQWEKSVFVAEIEDRNFLGILNNKT